MKCPYCENEMKDGYLYGSKDGAFSFSNEVPSMLSNAKKAEGFIQITEIKANHRMHVKASVCEGCRKVIFDY